MEHPDILVIMTDEGRYPPPYELFTGQYPSLHGASQTDGLAEHVDDPRMQWLDPGPVPTLGDWFRAGGNNTHYRGTWHLSNAGLPVPGSHDALMACDVDGTVLAEAVEAYRRADRLDPFGFSGWIGREPHGANRADSGTVRDGIFTERVVELFDDQAGARDDGPWLAVASYVALDEDQRGDRDGSDDRRAGGRPAADGDSQHPRDEERRDAVPDNVGVGGGT